MELKLGYKQTEVGLIPGDWDVQKVGESFNIYNNLRFPISRDDRKRMVGPYPYYGPTSIQSYINEYRVEGEYALIGEDGDHFLKWREKPMTLLVNGKFNVNNHAHLVKGLKNLTSWFFFYFYHRDLTSHLTRQGAGRYKLTKYTLERIPIALPPPDEQRAIAKALSDVDALIAALDQLIAKKRDIKQGAMQQLLTGKTRLPGFDKSSGKFKQTEVGLIPDDWDNRPLSSVVSGLEAGVSVNSVDEGSAHLSQEKCILKTSAVSNGSFTPSECKKIVPSDLKRAKLNPREDTIIISRMNTPDLVGESGYVGRDYPNLFIPDRLWMTRFRQGNDLSVRWLSYVMSGRSYKQRIKNIATGTSGSMKNISKGGLLSLVFPFPPYLEQQAIAKAISDMDAEITALEARRNKTKQLKQGMMQELLTGRTRLV